jgi:hypothetical protein
LKLRPEYKEAQAEAEANRLIAESITPELLERWKWKHVLNGDG